MQIHVKNEFTNSNLEQYMTVNGKAASEMDLEPKNGKMTLYMKAAGGTDEPMEKAHLRFLMETCMKGPGLTTKCQRMAPIPISMGQGIMGNGKMISKTAKASKHGTMGQNMTDSTITVQNTGLGCIGGLTGAHLKANGKKTQYQD